jgi:hypothetical protein
MRLLAGTSSHSGDGLALLRAWRLCLREQFLKKIGDGALRTRIRRIVVDGADQAMNTRFNRS